MWRKPQTVSDTKYYYNTVPKIVYVEGKEIHEISSTKYPVPMNMDSGQIARERQEYYTDRLFTDTIKNDSIRAIITDSVFMNRIHGRKFQYQFLFPVAVTQTRIEPFSKVQLGFFVNGGAATKLGVGGAVTFNTSKNYYQLGYDPFNKSVHFGMGWELKNPFTKKPHQ